MLNNNMLNLAQSMKLTIGYDTCHIVPNDYVWIQLYIMIFLNAWVLYLWVKLLQKGNVKKHCAL